jgi:hypothetical protein
MADLTVTFAVGNTVRGVTAPNQKQDMRKVKTLLNRVPVDKGGLNGLPRDKLLNPDDSSKSGPEFDKLVTAIGDFQEQAKLFPHPDGTFGRDGRVDPNERTIKALNRLATEEDPFLPPTAPSVPGAPAPTLLLSRQCQVIGDLKDDPSAPDMQFADGNKAIKSTKTGLILAPFFGKQDTELEQLMRGAVISAMPVFGGGPTEIAIGNDMCTHFFLAAGRTKTFAKGSDASNDAKTDDGLKEFVDNIRAKIDSKIRRGFDDGLINDQAIAAELKRESDATPFEPRKLTGPLTVIIGGFQGYHVEMCGLKVDTINETFNYTLDIEIVDHFGVDDSDVGGAVNVVLGASVAPFFMLQHFSSGKLVAKRLSKYRPFRTVLQTDLGPFFAKRRI